MHRALHRSGYDRPMHVNELAEAVQVPQPTIPRHLKRSFASARAVTALSVAVRPVFCRG